MTLKGVFGVCVTLLILSNLYRYFEYWTLINAYALDESSSSLLDYACDKLDSFKWKLRRKLKLRYYNSFKVFRNITIFKCVLQVLFTLLVVILYFLIYFSEYGVYLDVKW